MKTLLSIVTLLLLVGAVFAQEPKPGEVFTGVVIKETANRWEVIFETRDRKDTDRARTRIFISKAKVPREWEGMRRGSILKGEWSGIDFLPVASCEARLDQEWDQYVRERVRGSSGGSSYDIPRWDRTEAINLFKQRNPDCQQPRSGFITKLLQTAKR